MNLYDFGLSTDLPLLQSYTYFYCLTQGSAKPPPWAILSRGFAAKISRRCKSDKLLG